MTYHSTKMNKRKAMWANLKETFQYRLALKYDLIKENDKEIKFYYELHENEVTHKIPTVGKHNGNSYIDWR